MIRNTLAKKNIESSSIYEIEKIIGENNSLVEVVSSLIARLLDQEGIEPPPSFFRDYSICPNKNIVQALRYRNADITLKTIENYIESRICLTDKGENGIVFTPTYIIDYIIENIGIADKDSKIMDPSCGCGSFLVAAAKYMSKRFDIPLADVISKNLYGMDIVRDFAEYTKLMLALLCVLNKEDHVNLHFNILCENSLTHSWNNNGPISFDYIIGNPPYSNAHDLSCEMREIVKNEFTTTKKGTSNIFYAFIERSLDYLSPRGVLGFIIPNNFLTITAAFPLRKMLKDGKYVSKIINFNENMVFYPVRTYNSLLFLNKKEKTHLEYRTLEKTSDIRKDLYSSSFDSIDYDDLSDDGWILLPRVKIEEIKKIEGQKMPIKKYIHAGIATLRDNLYLVDGYDENRGLYYKFHGSEKYYIEKDIVRKIYKISEIEAERSLDKALRNIICPYTTAIQTSLDGKKKKMNRIISEEVMKESFPLCYQYFTAVRSELNKRDQGKEVSPVWYAYGRTQGLNFSGRKLLFPTFSNRPKFMLLEDEDALFCNGYAFVEEEDIELEVVQRIVNSDAMDHYVLNTSYSIEGGYYCYQKKFIQNFSIPCLTKEEEETIISGSTEEVNALLSQKYGVPFPSR